jgi:nucleotide-binding universal stress UspA family protein
MKILSATDFLPKSEAAIERAGFLADTLGAELTIVHAVPPDSADGNTLEQRVRRADSRLAARTSPPKWGWSSQAEVSVQCGHPSRVVLDNAYRQKADLVVLGPHRGNGVMEVVNGTITEKVLGAAASPVLIVQQEMQGPYRHVLLALDGSPDGGEIVRAVESLNLTRESVATAVHAHEPPYLGMMNVVGVGMDAATAYADSSRAQAEANIRALIEANSADGSRYGIVVIEHRPVTAIQSAVNTLKPDLVVLGTRGHGRFRRALLGSVATEVMNALQCDVLLVPERAGRAERAAPREPANAAAYSARGMAREARSARRNQGRTG